MTDYSQSKRQFHLSNRFFDSFSKSLSTQLTRLVTSSNPELLVILVIFVINLLLVSPKFMPSFSEINPFDEAKYVESGWLFLKGEIRSLAWGPLVALFYAPVHLLVGNSPDWFMIETWVGRFLLFGFLWLSLTYLAFQLKDYASPFVMVGLLFVTIPMFPIIENQSDVVFVSLSVLGLANLIAFSHNWRSKNLCLASIFVGLGVLARVETGVLIGTLAVITFAIGRKRHPVLKTLAAAILPALGILACLFMVNLINEGNLNLGISNKSYQSFEVNQSVLTDGDAEKARQESRRLFGTQAENNSSVLRAILRNPQAFGSRILANAKGISWSYFYFFGKTQGFVLLLFSAWGIYTLIHKRAFSLLIILLLWPLHAGIPLAFLARHVIPQTYYLPMILGAIGMAAAFALDSRPIERALLLIVSTLSCLYSWVDHKPAFLYGSILVTAIFGITWLLRPRLLSSGNARLAPLILVFIAGLILRDPYPFPDYSALGKSSAEIAVHYMENNLPVRTKVLVPFPLPAVAARMVDVTTSSIPKDIDAVQDLWTWLSERDIRAAYVDDRYQINKDISALLESGLGQYFDIGFTSQDGFVRVFLVRDHLAIRQAMQIQGGLSPGSMASRISSIPNPR